MPYAQKQERPSAVSAAAVFDRHRCGSGARGGGGEHGRQYPIRVPSGTLKEKRNEHASRLSPPEILRFLPSCLRDHMPRFAFRTFIVPTVALLLFSFVPRAEVAEANVLQVVYQSKQLYDQRLAPDQLPDGWELVTEEKPLTFSRKKSGLRIAFEGRLKWLGLADDISLPLTCKFRTPQVVCSRWF